MVTAKRRDFEIDLKSRSGGESLANFRRVEVGVDRSPFAVSAKERIRRAPFGEQLARRRERKSRNDIIIYARAEKSAGAFFAGAKAPARRGADT